MQAILILSIVFSRCIKQQYCQKGQIVYNFFDRGNSKAELTNLLCCKDHCRLSL
jgi:hypothetical protein